MHCNTLGPEVAIEVSQATAHVEYPSLGEWSDLRQHGKAPILGLVALPAEGTPISAVELYMQAEKLGHTVLIVVFSRTGIFAHDASFCHGMLCWLLLSLYAGLAGFLTDIEQCSTIFGMGRIVY